MADDWVTQYEQALPSLLKDYNTALGTQASGNESALQQYINTVQGQQNGGINTSLLAYASGLLKPTSTGSFFESMGNAGQAGVAEINKQRAMELDRAQTLAKIQMAKNAVAAELTQKRLEAAGIPLQATGAIATALGNQANSAYIRGAPMTGAAATVPGGKPGTGAQTSIRSADAGDAATPDVTAPPIVPPGTGQPWGGAPATPPAPPAAAPPPVPPAPAPAPNPPVQTAEAPPAIPAPAPSPVQSSPLPPIAGGGETITLAPPGGSGAGVVSGDGNAGPDNPPAKAPPPPTPPPPPKTDFTAKVPAPMPVPQDWSIGQQYLGNGVWGYRPTAATARQLDAATQLYTQGQKFRGSSLAKADSDKAQEYLKSWQEKGFMWDPSLKVLVPTGTADPQYQQRLKDAEATGTGIGKAKTTIIQRPTGQYGTGPKVYDTEAGVLGEVGAARQAQAEAAAGAQPGATPAPQPGVGGAQPPPAGVPTPSGGVGAPVAAPGVMDENRIKQSKDVDEEVYTAAKTLPQSISSMATVKDTLKSYQTGAFADKKAEVIAMLRAAGAALPDGAEKMDDTNFQIMTKNAINQVFAQVKDIGGRVLASEIQGLSKAVFDPNMSPGANRELVSSINAALKYQQKFVDDYNAWRNTPEGHDNPNVLAFKSQWAKDNDYQKFKDYELTTTVTKGAEKIDKKHFLEPSMEERREGMIINNPNSSTGLAVWTKDGWAKFTPK